MFEIEVSRGKESPLHLRWSLLRNNEVTKRSILVA